VNSPPGLPPADEAQGEVGCRRGFKPSPATDWRPGLAAAGNRGGEDPGIDEGGGGGFLPHRVGKMTEKKRAAKVVSVKVLNKDRVANASELRVVVKGGKTFVFRVSKPVLNDKKLILHNEYGVPLLVTSTSRLAADIEEFFKKRGMEPLYIYPASQLTIE
jgi:hypothetical protein